MICRPTGNPLLLRPAGAVVAGQPVKVAGGMYERRLQKFCEPPSGMGIMRWSVGVGSCVNAVVKAVGSRNTSTDSKNLSQSARYARRLPFFLCHSAKLLSAPFARLSDRFST